MSNKDIRSKATAVRESTEGMISLFLAPVFIMILSGVIDNLLTQLWGQAEYVLFGNTVVKNGVTQTVNFISIGPSAFFDFLSECLIVTACFQLIRVVRKEKKKVSFVECFSLLDGKIFLPIVVTILLKQIVLYIVNIPMTVGVALILFSLINPIIMFGSAGGFSIDVSSFFSSSNLYLGLILLLVGIVVSLFVHYSLSQVTFLLYDYLEKAIYTSPFQIFKQSWQLMGGNKWRRFLLDLSFIGWFIGVLLTFGLLGLYVYPYYWTCQAIFYEELTAKNPLIFLKSESVVSSSTI